MASGHQVASCGGLWGGASGGGAEVCDEESRKEVVHSFRAEFHNNRSLHLSSMHPPFS